jgi:Tol biopolymer transport system component
VGEVMLWSNLLPMAFTAVTIELLNAALVVGAVSLQTAQPAFEIWKQNVSWAVPMNILGMIVGGGGLANMTKNSAEDFSPAWSPDGSRIAFDSNRNGNYEIFVMNADSTGVMNMTNHADWDVHPSWSSDGGHIAFVSDRDGNWEIYAMLSNASREGRVTNHPHEDDHPSWTPDNTRITFATNRDDPDPDNCGLDCNYEIYVTTTSGDQLVRLTNHPAQDLDPAWAPQ